MTRWVDGLAALAGHYDAFVLDQYGVLHDGRQAYPGVPAALAMLREQGKRALVLSNSGKRAAHNTARLARFGIEHLDGVISSGEVCWQMLARRDRAPWAALGRRAFVFHERDDAAMLEGLDLQIVPAIADADFLLLASLHHGMRPADLTPLLLEAAARRLPMICANPDLARLIPGGLEPSSGSVALLYESLGGPVIWVGKPHPLVYAACAERLAELGLRDPRRICVIGDSLAHDVLGGSRAGFDTCFIAGGLHAADFGDVDTAGRQGVLDALPRHAAPAPVWAMNTLQC